MREDTTHALAELLDGRSLERRHQVGLLGLAALALVPAVVRDITVLKVTGALFFAVFVMSWDAVSGYTGQISFGHALFFGVGGYTSGMLNVHLGVDPLLGIPAGMVMAAVAGTVIGVPALRVRGPYLSLITLVAPLILLGAFRYFSPWTGGEIGLVSVGLVDKLPLDALGNYYLAFGLFVLALAVFLAVTRSDAGSVFTAIRADEEAVAAAGLNPAKFKIFAFVLSAAVGGLAGAAFAHSNVGSVTPSELLSLTLSIEVIIATIFGGIGTIVGPAVGGFVFYLLGDALRNLEALKIPIPFADVLGLPDRVVVEMIVPVVGTPVKEIDLLLFAVITLGFLFFVPEGILPRALRWGRRLEARLAERRPVADGGSTAAADAGRPSTAGPASERSGQEGRPPLREVLATLRADVRALRGGDDAAARSADEVTSDGSAGGALGAGDDDLPDREDATDDRRDEGGTDG